MRACSALRTIYDNGNGTDNTHGATTNDPSSFNEKSVSTSVYRVTGFLEKGSIYISGLRVYWKTIRNSGSIFCGDTTKTPVNLTPRWHGTCKLNNMAGEVDQVDGKLIRTLDFTWQCHY